MVKELHFLFDYFGKISERSTKIALSFLNNPITIEYRTSFTDI